MSPQNYTPADYLNALRRRLKSIVIVFFVVMAAAILAATMPPDYYVSAAEFRIDLEGPDVNLIEPVALTNYADQYVKSLQQAAMSKDNLRAWLEESNAFANRRTELSENELVRKLQDNIRIELVFTSVIEERSGAEVDLITGFQPFVKADSPEAAHSIAENLANQFIAEDRTARMQRAAAASSFLLGQIEAKRGEIVELEEKIARFKEENAGKLPELLTLNMTVLERAERDLESIETEMQALQQDRIFRQSQLQEIRQGSVSAERLQQLEDDYLRAMSLYGPDHPDVLRIRRQVAALTGGGTDAISGMELQQLQMELAEAQQKYSDEHPDVKRLKRRIASLTSAESAGAIPEEQLNPQYLQLRAQVNAIDTKLVSLRTRSFELRQKIENIEARIATTPQVELEFQALDRDLQTAKLAFNDLRADLAQAQQIESFEAGDLGARLVQITSAYLPDRPAGPKRVAIVLVGLFLATTLAGGIAILLELADSKIRGKIDILRVLHTQPIATVPVIQNSIVRSRRRRQIITMSFGAVALIALLWLAASRTIV
jgi:uncharacterized protein involved in exopolysaccharide biosynthesis